jgi:hypothetical protein
MKLIETKKDLQFFNGSMVNMFVGLQGLHVGCCVSPKLASGDDVVKYSQLLETGRSVGPTEIADPG